MTACRELAKCSCSGCHVHVRSCTIKQTRIWKVSSEIGCRGREIAWKASAASGNDVHTFLAVCFPFIAIDDVTSDPVNAWSQSNSFMFTHAIKHGINAYVFLTLPSTKQNPQLLKFRSFKNVKELWFQTSKFIK